MCRFFRHMLAARGGKGLATGRSSDCGPVILEGGVAMISDTSIRCVVWFGEPTQIERTHLAQAGWHTRVADAAAPGGGVGIRRGDRVVAMADVRKADVDTLLSMAKLMADHPRIPWLALVSADTSVQRPEVER